MPNQIFWFIIASSIERFWFNAPPIIIHRLTYTKLRSTDMWWFIDLCYFCWLCFHYMCVETDSSDVFIRFKCVLIFLFDDQSTEKNMWKICTLQHLPVYVVPTFNLRSSPSYFSELVKYSMRFQIWAWNQYETLTHIAPNEPLQGKSECLVQIMANWTGVQTIWV